MKFTAAILMLSVSTSVAGIFASTPIASLALPMSEVKSAESAPQPSTENAGANTNLNSSENITQGQPAPTDTRQSSETITEQPSTATRTNSNRHMRQALGVCSLYIPPYVKPGSFEYREGLDKC